MVTKDFEPVPVAQVDDESAIDQGLLFIDRHGDRWIPECAYHYILRLNADHARIVAELQARIERLSVEATNWYRAHTQAEASLAACRADAERYACVREHAWRAPGTFVALNNLPADKFDAAIDALRQEAPHAE